MVEYKGFNIELVNDNSYFIQGHGYRIQEFSDGVFFFPYKRETILDSAMAHVDVIISELEASIQETANNKSLREELANTKQQLTETQDALIELATLLTGGTN